MGKGVQTTWSKRGVAPMEGLSAARELKQGWVEGYHSEVGRPRPAPVPERSRTLMHTACSWKGQKGEPCSPVRPLTLQFRFFA